MNLKYNKLCAHKVLSVVIISLSDGKQKKTNVYTHFDERFKCFKMTVLRMRKVKLHQL